LKQESHAHGSKVCGRSTRRRYVYPTGLIRMEEANKPELRQTGAALSAESNHHGPRSANVLLVSSLSDRSLYRGTIFIHDLFTQRPVEWVKASSVLSECPHDDVSALCRGASLEAMQLLLVSLVTSSAKG